MTAPLRRFLLAAYVAALPAAAGCNTTTELEGAAAARSRGASVEGRWEPAVPVEPSATVDPWLDDPRVLARVNGGIITLREVRHAMGPAYEQYLDRRPELAAFVNARVRDLVLRRLIVEEAKRIGFTSTDEDLERETERAEKQAAEAGSTLDQTIRDLGMTRREWDDAKREDVLFQRALYYFTGQFPDKYYDEERFRPSVDFFVGPEEIRAFGEKHREALGILRPPTATLRFIDLRVDSHREAGVRESEAWRRCEKAMDAVEERLRDGASFAELAKELSEGPEAPAGGLAGPFLRDGPIREEYRAWAFREGRRDGDVSPRFRLSTGLVLVHMERLEPARSLPIEEWGPGVRLQLMNLKKTLAWNQVQIDLLERASITPPEVKARLVDQLRANNRRVREELEDGPGVQGSR